MAIISRCALLVFSFSWLSMPIAIAAANGLPLPGSGAPGYGGTDATAPALPSSVSGNRYSAPVPGGPGASIGANAGASGASFADRLPINAGNAQARLEVLRNLMTTTRPKEFQDSIGEFCEWLQDMGDAHWKLSQTFAKDGMKSQADAERQDAFKFGQLRRQAMLLKAQFLIAQRRLPEALGPLVDIIVAEPKTETGQSAYHLLQDIGFSHQVMPAAAGPSGVNPGAGTGAGVSIGSPSPARAAVASLVKKSGAGGSH